MTKELALKSDGQVAVSEHANPPVAAMLQAVIDKGLTSENVGVVEKLVGLYERMEAREAEKAFNAAFVALQAELPVIVAKSIIPNRGKYERYEDLAEVIGPILTKHGFTVSFSQDGKDGRITQTMHLRHVGGFSQATPFTVRTGGKADSDTQADSKASTTARRYAYINGLNLVIRQDESMREENDASLDGPPITWEQAAFLKEQVKETRSDERAFLEYAGAKSYEEIASNRYGDLTAALRAKGGKK